MKSAIKAALIAIVFIQNTANAIPITPLPYWANAEFLYWWPGDSSINVPLATKNNLGALAIIGQPGTEIVLGSGSSKDSFDFGGIGGVRVTVGGWLNNACVCGLEVSGFALTPRTEKLIASSGSAYPALNVPFFSSTTNREDVLSAGGTTNSVTDKNTFQPASLELNALYRYPYLTRFPLVLSAGIRYFSIDDKVELQDAVYGVTSLPPGSVLNIEDQFSARNHFLGFQLGARTNVNYCDFLFEAQGEVALGVNFQQLSIRGQTNIDNQGALQPFGLFSEPSNIGVYKKNQISILPELQLKLSYKGINYLRPFITYTVMYMSNVNRAVKQIDRNINTSQNPFLGGSGVLTGTPLPTKQFNQSSLWLQGFGIGVEFG
jgi:hypothetical protein